MYVSATTTRSSAGTIARLYGLRVAWSAEGSAADRDRQTPALVHLRNPAGAHVVRAVSLKSGEHMAVRQPCEAVQEAKVTDAVEPLDHLRTARRLQVEEQVAIRGEAVGKQQPARVEVMLGVMGP